MVEVGFAGQSLFSATPLTAQWGEKRKQTVDSEITELMCQRNNQVDKKQEWL